MSFEVLLLIYLFLVSVKCSFEIVSSSALRLLTVVCHSMTQRPDPVVLLSGLVLDVWVLCELSRHQTELNLQTFLNVIAMKLLAVLMDAITTHRPLRLFVFVYISMQSLHFTIGLHLWEV